VLGEAGVRRALKDQSMGGGVGMDEAGDTLAGFVTARMGQAVLERSVRPIVAGIYTADPTMLATDTVTPGLRAETARHGSLAAAVAARLAAAGSRRTPEACVEGGMFVFVDALRAAIEEAGGTVLTRTGAFAMAREASGWVLECGPTKPGPTPGAEPVPAGPGVSVTTQRLVLACSASAALRLVTEARIPGLVPDVSVPEGAPIARLTLAVRAPELDDAPVSQGLLVAPAPADERPVAAKALSHLNVKWPWLADQCAPHTHLLRLSYGRLGEAEPDVTVEGALRDIRALTGVAIAPEAVTDYLLARWNGTLPPLPPEYRGRVAALDEQVRSLGGVALTGAWVAGTGIASVVTHARAGAKGLL